MKVLTIGTKKYEIEREITNKEIFSVGDVRRKYRFFSAKNVGDFRVLVLANYGKYWACGNNFYDSSKMLEAEMFSQNRDIFMPIIENDKNQQKIIEKSNNIGKVLPLLFPLLDSIKVSKDERYRPKTTDKIVNQMAEYSSVAEKRKKYNEGLDRKQMARSSSGKNIFLGTPGAEFNDVEFIYGEWCIQELFDKPTIKTRDNLEFFIKEKLPRQEHTNFDFFKASSVKNSMFGKYIEKDDFVIATYKTSKGVFTAYGKNISDARAFLAIKVFDEYQDVIEQEKQSNIIHQK